MRGRVVHGGRGVRKRTEPEQMDLATEGLGRLIRHLLRLAPAPPVTGVVSSSLSSSQSVPASVYPAILAPSPRPQLLCLAPPPPIESHRTRHPTVAHGR